MNPGNHQVLKNGKVAGGKPTTTELKEVSAEQITHAQSQRKQAARNILRIVHVRRCL